MLIQKQQYLDKLIGNTTSKAEVIAIKKYMQLKQNQFKYI
jgi:hypothetical protein